MSADVLQFTPRDLPTDGGKARILRKRDNFKFRNSAEPLIDNFDDIAMDHADPADYMPSEYCVPDSDPA